MAKHSGDGSNEVIWDSYCSSAVKIGESIHERYAALYWKVQALEKRIEIYEKLYPSIREEAATIEGLLDDERGNQGDEG